MTSLLRIESSPRKTTSVSRNRADRVIARLDPGAVTHRDIPGGLPMENEASQAKADATIDALAA